MTCCVHAHVYMYTFSYDCIHTYTHGATALHTCIMAARTNLVPRMAFGVTCTGCILNPVYEP